MMSLKKVPVEEMITKSCNYKRV